MKLVTQMSFVVGALLVSQLALADGKHKHHKHDHRYDDQYTYDHKYDHKHHKKHKKQGKHSYHDDYGYDDRYHGKRKHGKRHHYANQVLRLDVPVRFRGKGRMSLSRALYRHHGIDVNNYIVRKVVVDNYSHREGVARVRSDYASTDRIYLTYGRNHIRLPRQADSNWVLRVRHAKVDNVRVVLEPKPRYANYRDGYKHRKYYGYYPRFENARPKWW